MAALCAVMGGERGGMFAVSDSVTVVYTLEHVDDARQRGDFTPEK
jgi:hypothetical protein